MESSKFDEFTKKVATSRRNFVGIALGFAGAALLPFGDASAKNDFLRAGKKCDRGQSCGSLAPCTNGICTPIACLIGGQVVQPGEPNSDNTCQYCLPTVDDWTDWLGISSDGTECTPGDVGGCLAGTGACSGGSCIADVLGDGSPCGDGQTCCSGGCCDPGQCCGATGACEACSYGCDIDGTSYEPGASNPAHDCQLCDPDRSTDAWSPSSDGLACGGVSGRICCNGECCSPTECCNGFTCVECGSHCRIDNQDTPAGTPNPNNDCEVCDPAQDADGWSVASDGAACGSFLQVCCNGICCASEECCDADRTCDRCGCTIEGDTYDDAEPNRDNVCLVCDAASSQDSWSYAAPDSACGSNNDRHCCDGECCPASECCSLVGCTPCPCEINGQQYGDGDFNPSNSCQICDINQALTDWTLVDDGLPCPGDPTQECCAGQCCLPGECCKNGACAACGCKMGNDEVDANTPHPSEPCLVCDPARNLFDWSAVLDDTPCGPGGGQVCCAGVCCAAGDCCLLGACGTCLCSIEGTNYPSQAPNPANPCEICDEGRDAFDWSSLPDSSPCGTNGEVCCSGHCCDPGECCFQGICGSCGCSIGETDYDAGAGNPDNSCEYCDPALDRYAWSSVSDSTSCGPSGTQVCCGGTCCADVECCGLSGACELCSCSIGGAVVPQGAFSPDDECLICDPLIDPAGYSPETGSPCGTSEFEFCCEGTCCAAHECCDLGNACAPCRCLIGEFVYLPGEPNPSNTCQLCDPYVDPLGWADAAANAPCGGNDERFCCAGECCAAGDCCHAEEGACGAGPCLCEIGNERIDAGTVNPADACQVCDPEVTASTWSASPDNTACGVAGTQKCCAGECCPEGQCCLPSGLCGPCECTIDGSAVPAWSRNPLNDCQLCSPGDNPNGWTTEPEGASCGPNLTYECCAGECKPSCQPLGCIIDGVFYPSGQVNPNNYCEVCDAAHPTIWSPNRVDVECPQPCWIGGVLIPDGTVNPDNECECCNGRLDQMDWSICDQLMCGPQQDMHCCNGICCGADECCGSDSACTSVDCPPEACTIDGVEYQNYEVNPANQCEWCLLSTSSTSWTPQGANTACGANGDQYCCAGQCCPLGVCCNGSTGVCEAGLCKLCVINGVVYGNAQRNPANGCEWCNPLASTTSWSLVNDNYYCDPGARQGACCHGSCCPTGTFCNTNGYFCDTF